jgi:hypothetical protein
VVSTSNALPNLIVPSAMQVVAAERHWAAQSTAAGGFRAAQNLAVMLAILWNCQLRRVPSCNSFLIVAEFKIGVPVPSEFCVGP